MGLTKKDYQERLIDEKIDRHLKVFGAVSIEGPKWCGKTWTSLNHSNSVVYMTEKEVRDLAKVNPKYIFSNDYPELIDEWQLVPSIWDSVRHACDEDHLKGKFILTGSTSLSKDEKEDTVFHSGAGRIATLKMNPMSLYESHDSTGDISIRDMLNDKVIGKPVKKWDLEDVAHLIIRGGWPENIYIDKSLSSLIPINYIEAILLKDIHERNDKKRDSNKMRMLMRSLARNESSIVSIETLIKDISLDSCELEKIESRKTVNDYLSVLDSLYLTANQEAFSLNYRSSKRIGKSPKRHFICPSLSCALLRINENHLMHDLNTFGFMFESLVERDLRIYMDYLDGNLYHFRDNVSGDEVDAILEFNDSEYAAVEIKLTEEGIGYAKESLMKFYENVRQKPKFMAIIVGTYGAVLKDPDTGIYILPITALKP